MLPIIRHACCSTSKIHAHSVGVLLLGTLGYRIFHHQHIIYLIVLRTLSGSMQAASLVLVCGLTFARVWRRVSSSSRRSAEAGWFWRSSFE